ncbi:glycosyltransferase family 4 protein [Fibrella sp. HMF5335]|uniref:Glycosyltransferase family 4 protein n=1 Tax=Fibrella rubiginis TaxID=2817060 RepID=A0A939K342_9BACT|nr:glycosyltransferase family 4 protein [Fibrella rubiginis]MBO0938842.1 glycosyltransferase family 4 protein [Fibrella rubiginis]
MNVLIVTFLATYSPSGVVTYYRTLSQDLVRRGHQVTVVETTDTPPFWNKLLNIIGHVFNRLGTVSRVIWFELSYFVRLYLGARARRTEAFDVIHAQDVRSGVAAWLALGKKVPVVLTCHFNDDPVTELTTANKLPGWLQKQLTRWYGYLFSQVRNYVFVSDYAYQKSKHLLPADVNKVILYNTVSAEIATATITHEASEEGLTISNVGYVDERKNQKLLIEVGDELRRRGVEKFNIWLIGDGPKRTEYEQLVAELKLTDHVTFYGRQAAPWRLVAQTDLYVHTALNDNCPYSIIEAMAVQTPVLALPVGGIPEMVPGHDGLLKSTDAEGVTDEILHYFDPAERKTLAIRQADFAAVHFDHETALTRLITFYDQALNEPLSVLNA